jgi:hypothetical protein
VSATESFTAALLTMVEHDTPPPCTHDNRWTSDDHGHRATAASLCRTCPLITQCSQYAHEIKATHGVWAGHDYTKSQRRPREATS